jgi:hypothetical protein
MEEKMTDKMKLLIRLREMVETNQSNTALSIIDSLIGMEAVEDDKIDPEEQKIINEKTGG